MEKCSVAFSTDYPIRGLNSKLPLPRPKGSTEQTHENSKISSCKKTHHMNSMERAQPDQSKTEGIMRILNPAIIILSDTHWSPNISPSFKSYSVIRKVSSTRAGGGIAILIYTS